MSASSRGLEDSSRLSMRQLSSSLVSDAARQPASPHDAAAGDNISIFSPDIILRLRSAVDELESSHLDSSREGSDSFHFSSGPVRGDSATLRAEGAGPRAGREKSSAKRGLAAEVAAAAAAAAAEEDFARWGYRSGHAVGREDGTGRSGRVSERNDRRSESVRQPGTVYGLQEQVMQDVDITGMRALLSMQQAECDGLTRAVQAVRNAQQRSEALVAEELKALRSSLDYHLLPAYRQELEREMVANPGGAAEASPWAVQACVAIRFLQRVLEEQRSQHDQESKEVTNLHRHVSVLVHKCATLQEGADVAARAAGDAAGAASEEIAAKDREIEQMRAHIAALKEELSREYVDKIQLLVSAGGRSAHRRGSEGGVVLDDADRGRRVIRAPLQENDARIEEGLGVGKRDAATLPFADAGADRGAAVDAGLRAGGDAVLGERYDRLLGVDKDKVAVRMTKGGGGGVSRGWVVPKREATEASSKTLQQQPQGSLRPNDKSKKSSRIAPSVRKNGEQVVGTRASDQDKTRRPRRVQVVSRGGFVQEGRGACQQGLVEEQARDSVYGAARGAASSSSDELADTAGDDDDDDGSEAPGTGSGWRRQDRSGTRPSSGKMAFAKVPREGQSRQWGGARLLGHGNHVDTASLVDGVDHRDAYSSLRQFLENESMGAVKTNGRAPRTVHVREASAVRASQEVVKDKRSSSNGHAQGRGAGGREVRAGRSRRQRRNVSWDSSESSMEASGQDDVTGAFSSLTEEDSLEHS